MTCAFAQLERSLVVERVKAGMDRARKQGKHVGRPRKLNGEWDEIRPAVLSGRTSRREAARILGVSRSTVARAHRATAAALSKG